MSPCASRATVIQALLPSPGPSISTSSCSRRRPPADAEVSDSRAGPGRERGFEPGPLHLDAAQGLRSRSSNWGDAPSHARAASIDAWHPFADRAAQCADRSSGRPSHSEWPRPRDRGTRLSFPGSGFHCSDLTPGEFGYLPHSLTCGVFHNRCTVFSEPAEVRPAAHVSPPHCLKSPMQKREQRADAERRSEICGGPRS